jgi:hypothetical protein
VPSGRSCRSRPMPRLPGFRLSCSYAQLLLEGIAVDADERIIREQILEVVVCDIRRKECLTQNTTLEYVIDISGLEMSISGIHEQVPLATFLRPMRG